MDGMNKVNNYNYAKKNCLYSTEMVQIIKKLHLSPELPKQFKWHQQSSWDPKG